MSSPADWKQSHFIGLLRGFYEVMCVKQLASTLYIVYLLLWLFIVIIGVIAGVVILPHFPIISPLFYDTRGTEPTLHGKY